MDQINHATLYIYFIYFPLIYIHHINKTLVEAQVDFEDWIQLLTQWDTHTAWVSGHNPVLNARGVMSFFESKVVLNET